MNDPAASIHLQRGIGFNHPNIASRFVLQQIQVVHRHGERSPISLAFPNKPFVGENKQLCASGSMLISQYLELTDSTFSINNKASTRPTFSGFRLIYDDRLESSNCKRGQLTEVGKESLFKLGSNLNQHYAKKLGLNDAPNPSEILVFSTDVPRAMESAQKLLQGMFPKWNPSSRGAPMIDIRVREDRNEFLYPNITGCKRLRRLLREMENKTIKLRKEEVERLEKLSEGITRPQLKEGALVNAVYDSISCYQPHGVSLPPQVTPEMGTLSESLMVGLWWDNFAKSHLLTKLGIGRLVADMVNHLQMKAQEKNSLKFVEYSGHDSTVAPILAAYEVFDHKWPPFASNIILELYKDTAPANPKDHNVENNHYVRMLYNNEALKIPGCQETAVEGGFLCPLSTFLALSKKVIPENYEEACKE